MPIAGQEMPDASVKTEKQHSGRLKSLSQQQLSVSSFEAYRGLILKGLECVLSSNKIIQRQVNWGCHVETLHCIYQKKKR